MRAESELMLLEKIGGKQKKRRKTETERKQEENRSSFEVASGLISVARGTTGTVVPVSSAVQRYPLTSAAD